MQRSDLTTEASNKVSRELDKKPINEILLSINDEDQSVAKSVRKAIGDIEKTVNLCTEAIKSGHRIFYVGAGTSGRLGVLDASEIPPTFSADSNLFTGIIAGGDRALRNSVEGAEDDPDEAIKDLNRMGFSRGDVLIGISASGAALYVKSSIERANSLLGKTVYFICNKQPFLKVKSTVVIRVNTGPEVVTGSTRMKAGTATKMVLNMISTATMVGLGKVYGNLMVDLMAVNEKLIDRGLRIIQEVTNVDKKNASIKLFEADKSVKTAIVMIVKSLSKEEAVKTLAYHEGILRNTLR